MDKSDLPRMAYRIPEVVKIIGISRAAVYRELKERRLHAIKVGNSTLITAEALKKWLTSLGSVAR